MTSLCSTKFLADAKKLCARLILVIAIPTQKAHSDNYIKTEILFFFMGWKDWSYWLKGLIVGIGISIIIFLIEVVSGLGCMQAYNFKEPSLICDSIAFIYEYDFGRLIVHPVFILIVSTLVGFLIGKIKSFKTNK